VEPAHGGVHLKPAVLGDAPLRDAPARIWVEAPDGRLSLNAAWPPSDSDPRFDGMEPAEAEVRRGLHVSARRGEPVEPRTWRIREGPHSVLWLESLALVPHGDGQALMGLLVDVTTLGRPEAQRRGAFMNEAAHELRNRLTPLVMQLQLLQARPDLPEERRQRSLAAALRYAERADQLLGDVLEVTRIHGGKRPLQRVRLDLGALVADAAEEARPLAEELGVSLEVRQPPETVWATGDAARVKAALGHLLRNALRAGGGVEVTVARQEAEAVVAVRDRGVGLTLDDLRRYEKPFPKPAGWEGSGLGLAFVRDVAQGLGGSFTLHSPGPGKGATATLRLPAA
jgi:signal transduction histidine kinase